MSDKSLNLLFTSAGRRSYLIRYFQEALQGTGRVFAANSSPLSAALAVADERVVTPLIYEDSYIPFLLDYCKNNRIHALMSLFDVDLPVLAAHKEVFAAQGTRVLVSDPALTEICNDKWKSSEFLRENGFAVIPSFLDLKAAEQALDRGEIHFPLIVKPRWGMGSLSVFEAENPQELTVLYHKVRREIFDSYLKYESALDRERAVLIQQKIKGREYGMDIICDLTGQYVGSVVREKLAMRSGETDCARILADPELLKLGERLGRLTRHVANLDIDVILSEESVPYILEMNPRFGGGYPFSHLAGVNLPGAIINWLRGEPVPQAWFQPRVGLVAQKDISLLEMDLSL